MDMLISLAWVAMFLAALVVMSGAVLGWDSRSGRITNCFSSASALAVLYATGVLQNVLDAGPWEMLGAWGGVIFLATLFVYGTVLEVASWFGGQ